MQCVGHHMELIASLILPVAFFVGLGVGWLVNG